MHIIITVSLAQLLNIFEHTAPPYNVNRNNKVPF